MPMCSDWFNLIRAGRRLAGRCAWMLIIVCAPVFGAESGAPERYEDLVLEVSANAQQAEEMLVVLRDAAGGYWFEEADFGRLRLKLPSARAHEQDGRRYLPLAAIAGATFALDEARAHLDITLPPAAYLPVTLTARAESSGWNDPASTGLMMNYQLYGQRVAGVASGGAFTDMSLFSRAGVLGNSLTLRNDGARTAVSRLDTTFTRDFPGRMQTLRLGDSISSPGRWGSALRFAGVQFGRNFALRPDLVTAPLLSISGDAVVPSAVDVFVNSQHVFADQVQPGPFTIDRLPVVSGAGEVRMVVRDALGREQVITQNFYSSPSLLAPGLDQYSVSFGALRRNYTRTSFDYGSLVGSGEYRRGLTRAVTAEGHLEAAQHGAVALGGSLAARTGSNGIAEMTLAAGGASGDAGVLAGAGLDLQGARLSMGVSASYTSSGYRQVADLESEQLRPRVQVTARAGLSMGLYGSFSLAYARRDHRSAPADNTLGLSYFLRLGNAGMLSLLVNHTRSTASGTSAFLGYSMSVGTRRSLSSSVESARGGGSGPATLRSSMMQAVPVGEGSGWRLSATQRGSYDAAWQQRRRFADMEVQAARDNGVSGQSMQVHGGLTFMGGTTRAMRGAEGSFAVVDVAGIEGVPVYLENHLVARTDRHGRAVLSDLLPYEANRISVDPVDVPLDTEITHREIVIQPAWRSGVMVRFPVQRIAPALFRLVQQGGPVVPAGATVAYNGGEFVVAKDGVTYVTTHDHGTTGTARWDGGRCVFRLEPAPAGEPLADLGDVLCREASGAAR